MRRFQNPNYPVISLPRALELVEVIYGNEPSVAVQPATLAAHIGQSGLHGASQKIISALAKYRLLDAVDDGQFIVSNLALTIIQPRSPEERQEALNEAAWSPALFQRIQERFENKRPSEMSLRSWLLQSNFPRSAIDNVTRVYGETLDYVGLGSSTDRTENDTRVVEERSEDGRGSERDTTSSKARDEVHKSNAVPEPYSVELLKGRVRVSAELTNKSDAEAMVQVLKSVIAFLPTHPPDRGSASSRAPEWDEDATVTGP